MIRKRSATRIFGLALTLVLFINVSKAQYNHQQPPILPQAPGTASLEKFGSYEVNLFNGIPNISIPLYTIKTPAFEIPVTLSYHASGNKISDYPGWVGLGWALDAGGQVSRTLMGKPDEDAFGFRNGGTRESGDLYPFSDQADVDYLDYMNQGQRDSGADIFSYSYPGGSGKFFFDKNDSYKPVLVPYAPVKIAFNHTANPRTFTITDGSGNRHFYDGNYSELSISSSTEGFPSMQTSSWKLERMIAANKKDTVSFTYHAINDVTPYDVTDTWTVTDMVDNTGATPFPNPTPYTPSHGGTTNAYAQTTTFGFQPQNIYFLNGKVTFELDATAREDFNESGNSKALKRIKVYRTTAAGDSLLKTITFYYSYFTNGNANSKRLRLDSLQMIDAGSSVISSYKFQYNTSVNLPEYASRSRDLWGYYNGKSNSSLIPKTDVSYTSYVAGTPTTITIGSTTTNGRDPDADYMQAGVLTRIDYPTRGYTEFTYETNRYYDAASSSSKLAGGLRIKSIKSYDDVSGSPLTKSYVYGVNEDGNGRKMFFLDNMFFTDEKYFEYWQYSFPMYVKTATQRQRHYYSNPTINVTPMDGSPVVYPKVTEYMGEGGTLLGKTVYHYRDSLDDVYMIGNYTKPTVSTRFFSRGQLLSKKQFKMISTGVYRPVEEDRYTYNTPGFSSAAKFAGLMVMQTTIREGLPPGTAYTPSTASTDWYYNNYYFNSDDNYLVSQTKKTYDAGDSTKYVSTTTLMEYPNFAHQQVGKTLSINSRGDTLISRTRYPADFAAGNAAIDTMVARNMQNVQIEAWGGLHRPSDSEKVTGGQLTRYQLTNGLVLPLQQESLRIATPVTNYQPAYVSSGTLYADSRSEPVVLFNAYDARGNILETQRQDGIKEAYLWSYRGAYPVAKITGASFSSVDAAVDVDLLYNPSVTQGQINTELAALRSAMSSPTVQVTTLNYKTLVGMISQTDPKGMTTYYEYDLYQRLKQVKDQDGNVVKTYQYHYKQ